VLDLVNDEDEVGFRFLQRGDQIAGQEHRLAGAAQTGQAGQQYSDMIDYSLFISIRGE